jgi:hypothetical protein
LAIAQIFIKQFLGKGNMSIAADVLDENVQAITAVLGHRILRSKALQRG